YTQNLTDGSPTAPSITQIINQATFDVVRTDPTLFFATAFRFRANGADPTHVDHVSIDGFRQGQQIYTEQLPLGDPNVWLTFSVMHTDQFPVDRIRIGGSLGN